MIGKEFIPYEGALALKELGFNETCSTFYTDEQELYDSEGWDYNQGIGPIKVVASLYQQAFRWFREKEYHAGIIPRYDEFHYLIKDFVNDNEYYDVYNLSSYEEAELVCLRKLIEIINQEQR